MSDPETPVLPYCNHAEVSFISVPLSYEYPLAGNYRFHYRFLPGDGSVSRPPVVYFPGGPGRGGIEIAESIRDTLGLDGSYPVLVFDPRGVNCSNPDESRRPVGFFSTEAIARDVIALLRHLNLRDSVFIGSSHGTAVATIAASFLEHGPSADREYAPQRILLTGVFGRAYDNSYGLHQPRVDYWNHRFQSFPADVQAILRSDHPYGHSPELLARWLYSQLDSPTIVDDLREQARVQEELDQLAELGDFMPRTREDIAAGSAMENTIRTVCYDMTRFVSYYPTLVDGHLFYDTDQGNLCSPSDVAKPFDAARFPISTDIVYIQGARDLATPLSGARHHFDSQTTAERLFLSVHEGGHATLAMDLYDSRHELMPLLLSVRLDSHALREALERCEVHLSRIYRPASR